MLRADDVDDVRQCDGELFDDCIPAVVEHVQRRILDVRQHGGDFGLAAALCVQKGNLPLDSLDITEVVRKIREGGTLC